MKTKLTVLALLLTILIAGCIIPQNARGACITDTGTSITLNCPVIVGGQVIVAPPVLPPSPPPVVPPVSPPGDHSGFTQEPINTYVTNPNPNTLYPGQTAFFTFTIPAGKTMFLLTTSSTSQSGNGQLFLQKGPATTTANIKANYDAVLSAAGWGQTYYKDNGNGTYSWSQIKGSAAGGEDVWMQQADSNGPSTVSDISGQWFFLINNASAIESDIYTFSISVQ